MKHKIYLFIEQSVASNYGIGTYVNVLSHALKDEFSISIVRLFTSDDSIVISHTDDIESIRFPYSYENDEFEYRYYKRVVFYLKNILLSDSQKVFFHFNNRLDILINLLKDEFHSAKYIYTMHYLEWKSLLCTQKIENVDWYNIINADNKVKKLIELELSFINQIDKIVVLSNSTYETIKKVFNLDLNKIVCIHNSVPDLFKTDFMMAKDLIKKELGFCSNDKICLFVGRVVPNKGIIELVRAFKKILGVIPNCKLLVVGDGCYDLCLKEIKPFFSKIIFTGYIEKELLIKLYHIADIGVLPSYFEECNYVVLEMMSTKLPYVISRVPGLTDFLDADDKFSVPCRNIESLAEKMSLLLQDQALREIYSNKVRLKFESEYNVDILQVKMIDLYKSL